MPYADPVVQAEYQRGYQKTWYHENKAQHYAKVRERKLAIRTWYEEIKRGLSCTECGETHPACLEFHHLDPSSKTDLVSQMAAQGSSKKRILAEIAKCIVLCSNCHRKLHASKN